MENVDGKKCNNYFGLKPML